jgi:hypoxanthine-DNA glycosylase
MYITESIYHEETLPWEAHIPNNADKLILGTFPTRSDLRRYEFFYPNIRNKFWEILASLLSLSLIHFNGNEAVEERKDILDQLHLAITDIGRKILRQNESSLDNNIFPIEFTDIFSLLDENPSIQTIIITSSTKGNSVLTWFKAYCELNKVMLPTGKEKVPWETYISVNQRKIKILVIYSTSGSAVIAKDVLRKMYKEAILENKIEPLDL